jgi:hypothetical protein
MSVSATVLLLWTLGCAPRLLDFYEDSFFPEDGIYANKILHFSLTYQDGWVISTDPNKMPANVQSFAREMQKVNAELLYVGATVEGSHGTRGIAVNLNLPERDYAERVREINKNDVETDYGLTEMLIAGHSMVRWVYVKEGFRFAEFFFTSGTYNVRIAFWTRPELFESFLPAYESIMGTLQAVSRF